MQSVGLNYLSIPKLQHLLLTDYLNHPSASEKDK